MVEHYMNEKVNYVITNSNWDSNFDEVSCSAESQKGIDAVQPCSVENQKGAIAVHRLAIAPF